MCMLPVECSVSDGRVLVCPVLGGQVLGVRVLGVRVLGSRLVVVGCAVF